MCRSKGLEVGEGTESMYSEPFCQIRNCTVASANASFSSLHSLRSRRSVCDRPPSGPGSDRSMPALPASTNRSRQFPTVADETPCRRAASASDNSPFNTANTTWICSSTATCRDGFCDLLTQTPFVTGQLRTLPQSLTHLTDVTSYIRPILIDGAVGARRRGHPSEVAATSGRRRTLRSGLTRDGPTAPGHELRTIQSMEMDRYQSQKFAQSLLSEADLRNPQDHIAAAQVQALIAIAEQLHEVARVIEKLGRPT
jgi:hypothetical protein